VIPQALSSPCPRSSFPISFWELQLQNKNKLHSYDKLIIVNCKLGGESSFGAEGPSLRGLLLRNTALESIEISSVHALL
jgi:hypothetical protein